MAHIHKVYDTDGHYIIDANTRLLKNASTARVTLVQRDHNSERITFELERFVDGHDMSLCNSVRINYTNKGASGSAEGCYLVSDLQISPDDPSVVVFSWLVSQHSTQYEGPLTFSIRFICSSDGSTVDYAWSTVAYAGLVVSKGLNHDGADDVYVYDSLQGWIDEANNCVALAKEAAATAQSVKESIPEDYTALSRNVAALTEELDAFALGGNVLPLCDIVTGSYALPDGTFATHILLNRTDYIPLSDEVKSVNVYGAFTVDGKLYALGDIVIFYGADKAFLSSSGENTIKGEVEIAVPDGASYAIVNMSAAEADKDALLLRLNTVNQYIGERLEKSISALEVSPDSENLLYRSVNHTVESGYYSYASQAVVEASDWSHIKLANKSYSKLRLSARIHANNIVNPITFVDARGVVISNGYQGNATGQLITDYTVDIPSSAAFIYISFDSTTSYNFQCVVVGLESVIKMNNGILAGKTLDALGDSITAQGKYTQQLAEMYGAVINNYGVSGSSISSKTWDAFHTRVDAMATCDCVFILGGTNDWGYSAPLGTKTDTTDSTFCGGLYLLGEAVRAKFPTTPVFISTILQRDWTDTATDATQCSGIDVNANGNSIAEFNEAIRYFANRYGFVVVDGFGESGICVPNIQTYTTDRLHLNDAGGVRMARLIDRKVNEYNFLFE